MGGGGEPAAAVALKLLASLCFSVVNGLSRHVSPASSLELACVVFFQNAFSAALACAPRPPAAPRRSAWPLHALRSASAVAGMAAWYASLRAVSFSRGAALGFLGPVVTTAGCVVVLGERLTRRRAACLALSFAGSLLVTRPDIAVREAAAENPAGAALAAGAAVCFAVSNVAARALAASGEDPAVMAAALSVSLAPAALLLLVLPAALLEGGAGGPSFGVASLLPATAAMGALAHAAHLATAHAYARADVLFLAPFGSARLLFSAAVGLAAFGEPAEPWPVVAGAAVLAAACVLLAGERVPSAAATTAAGKKTL